MRRLSLSALLFIPLIALALQAEAPKPPVAKKKPHVVTLHGETRSDDYFWLREKKDAEVIAHLEAENAYTAALTRHVEPLQVRLYKEFLGRIKQTDMNVPYRLRGHWYYSRTEEGKQYAIHCRKKGSTDAAEEAMLDGNELVKGHKFLSIGPMLVSDDNNLLAYSTDYSGFREYTLRVKDLRDGRLLPDRIDKVVGFAWAADSKTLFYIKEDHAKRPYALYRHELGGERDEAVYEEKDELFRLSVSRSDDKKYLFITSQSLESGETRCLPADQPKGEPKLLRRREDKHRYDVEHRDGLFYIRTDKDAKNFKLVTAPVDRSAEWTELVPHRPQVKLERLTMFARYLVMFEREEGLPHLAVRELASGATHRISFPEPVYSCFPDANPEYDVDAFRLRYQSLVTPDSVYEYDLRTRERRLLKQTDVLGGYDPSLYQSERIWAIAPDKTRIPISLVSRKGVARDGTAPLYLTGYGSYGASIPVTFSPLNLSLLDRGVIVAMAHIRGGGDLGEAWHDQGKMFNKKNTFTDFIACAEHLVREKYTAHHLLAIHGGSAGGLLIGTTLNLRPNLCKVAVLDVPFVDVINTMLDESLPLTVQEFLEWGNPKVKEQYDYMKSYCPYSNLAARDYPAILVTTSLNDSQVMYWEPAKYVARLRGLKTDRNPLLFKCNMAAGHGGASGRYDRFKEVAFRMAFVLDQLEYKE